MEKKKVIVIEAQRVFRRKKHGMDFVALELIRELQKIDHVNNYIIAVGPGEDLCLTETDNFKIEVLPSSNYFIWEQILLPRLLRKHKADLVHCTSNTAPIWGSTDLVLTLHDIIFMEKKMGNNTSMYQKLGRIYRRFVVPIILKKVKQVITVSHFEEMNILNYYPQLRNKIQVVYNGVGKEFTQIAIARDKDLQSVEKRSYWMFLGNTDPKKNMSNTLLAYAEYLKQSTMKRKLLLLDTGENSLEQELERLGISWIKPYLFIKDYVSHHHLPEWYSYAFGFLYTSLRESFGLPLIEAMACGTAVVGSNTSSIPEVAENSILYADPTIPDEISKAMLEMESSPELYERKIEQGKVQSAKYSWVETAVKTRKVYSNVLS